VDDARLLLTDDTWGRLAAIIREVKPPSGAPPRLPDRDFVEAVLYLARAGCPWRDLPARFGKWDAVYQRFRRWERRGIWRALFGATPADPAAIRDILFDSTVIRAHPHAAGAPAKKGGRRRRRWAARAAASAPRSTSRPATSGRPWSRS
jgi:putative transposase